MMERGEVIWNGVSRSSENTSRRDSAPKEKKASVSPSSSSSSISGSASASASASASDMQWDFLGAASSEASFLDLCEASQMPEESLDAVAQMLGQPSCGQNRGETDISRSVRYWQDGFRAGYEAANGISGVVVSAKGKDVVPVE